MSPGAEHVAAIGGVSKSSLNARGFVCVGTREDTPYGNLSRALHGRKRYRSRGRQLQQSVDRCRRVLFSERTFWFVL